MGETEESAMADPTVVEVNGLKRDSAGLVHMHIHLRERNADAGAVE